CVITSFDLSFQTFHSSVITNFIQALITFYILPNFFHIIPPILRFRNHYASSFNFVIMACFFLLSLDFMSLFMPSLSVSNCSYNLSLPPTFCSALENSVVISLFKSVCCSCCCCFFLSCSSNSALDVLSGSSPVGIANVLSNKYL